MQIMQVMQNQNFQGVVDWLRADSVQMIQEAHLFGFIVVQVPTHEVVVSEQLFASNVSHGHEHYRFDSMHGC